MKKEGIVVICLIFVIIGIFSSSLVSASLLTDIGDFFQNLFNIGDDGDYRVYVRFYVSGGIIEDTWEFNVI